MDRSFDTSLAAFFESGASQRGKLPWSGIKFLRLEVTVVSMGVTMVAIVTMRKLPCSGFNFLHPEGVGHKKPYLHAVIPQPFKK
eukprot:1158048-Pelagomonas_calceolata.AAC.1